jgi:hypothetical protein
VLVNGTFVSLTAGGLVIPADFRASQGPLPARGVLLQDAQMKDPRGNVLDTIPMASFTLEGRIGNLSGLTPGATYYLLSGGGFQAVAPGATTSDVDQVVGWAVTDSVLQICIGSPKVHA